jgi:hypothetical protein
MGEANPDRVASRHRDPAGLTSAWMVVMLFGVSAVLTAFSYSTSGNR